jgi:hypothetical protein
MKLNQIQSRNMKLAVIIVLVIGLLSIVTMFNLSYMLIRYDELPIYEQVLIVAYGVLPIAIMFIFAFFIHITKSQKERDEIIRRLNQGIYQQFDDKDLTVFNQAYFDNEDEVLNYILTQIPSWFSLNDVEYLYESIKRGFLVMKGDYLDIQNNRVSRGLPVFYIKG